MKTATMSEDIQAVKQTPRWPRWPYLPVKRYVAGESGPTCGVITAIDLHTVYEANLFNLPEDLTTCKQHKYSSLEALFDDGWVVD